MQDNIARIIETLKAETVGRCRERIEQASKKAHEIIGSSSHTSSARQEQSDSDDHGVTAIFKRRHGL